MKHFVVPFALLFLAACTYDPGTASDLECTTGDVREDGAQCVDGFWLAGDPVDMASDMVDVDMNDIDMGADMGCLPETNGAFCARLQKNCGIVDGTDNCGEARQADCGMCTSPDTCQADNTCSCVPEDDQAFCDRLTADCGMLTDDDNCGAERTVDCGVCEGNETCGEQQPNVCGCPCLIGGTCYPDGAENPNDQCEICDPQESTTDWTAAPSRMCDDNDLCTENDVCLANGNCGGAPVDCSSEDGECRVGQCDPANGMCFGQAQSGVSCSSDGLSCTDDVCDNGVCDHDLTGGCIIDNTCYMADTPNPNNGCEACLPGTSTTSWSTNDAGTCDDGLSCTTDVCMGGTCMSTQDSGTCLIDDTCYTNGSDNPGDSCETCAPSSSATDWTVKASCCVIGGTNYADGTENPTNDCQACDVGTDQSDWTDRPVNTSCCPLENGAWTCDGTGLCESPNGMMTTTCAP